MLVEERSQRAVARELGLARVTAPEDPRPGDCRSATQGPPAPRPVWDTGFGLPPEVVAGESLQWTGGKQRLTATWLHALLVAKGTAWV